MSHWILQITSGTGPEEVRQFVALLADALALLCAERGLSVAEEVVCGDLQAPRSVELIMQGPAPQRLGDLLGTHALVARSPRRGKRSRKRWFAGVSLHPAPADVGEVALDPADVDVSTARAGGPGGQHVNTTESAVRAVHRPTGVSVRVCSERSQHANRRIAMARLAQVLARRAQEEVASARTTRRQTHHALQRGSPICRWRSLERGPGLQRVEE